MGHSSVANPTPAPLTSTIALDVDLSSYDEEQVKLMEEMCIVIDNEDKRIGANTKKACMSLSYLRACSQCLLELAGSRLLPVL